MNRLFDCLQRDVPKAKGKDPETKKTLSSTGVGDDKETKQERRSKRGVTSLQKRETIVSDSESEEEEVLPVSKRAMRAKRQGRIVVS
jgi:hypothetical protein